MSSDGELLSCTEALLRIRRLLEGEGSWCRVKTQWQDSDGRLQRDLLGAVVEVCSGDDVTMVDVIRVLQDLTAPHSVSTWNDAVGRTQRQVLELLDRAIELSIRVFGI